MITIRRIKTAALGSAATAVMLASAAMCVQAAPRSLDESATTKLKTDKADQQRQIDRCNASWDTETRMSRAQFLAACTRVLGPHR